VLIIQVAVSSTFEVLHSDKYQDWVSCGIPQIGPTKFFILIVGLPRVEAG
jgi:hypothetical protein